MRTVLELMVSNAAAATLLGLVVLAASTIVHRPSVRHALWLIVLARLLAPPVWSVPISGSSPSAPVVGETVVQSPAPDATPIPAILPIPSDEPRLFETEPLVPDGPSRSEGPATLTRKEPVAVPPMEREWIVPALFGIWLIGVLAVVGLTVHRVRRFQRGLRDAVPAPEEWQRQAAELAVRLGCRGCPRVLLAPGRVPPLLWAPGLRPSRAAVVLPMELTFQLHADQRAALMAHELAHFRRGDAWVRWLEMLANVLYWWNPLLPLFRRRLRESEEQCCDAWVVARTGERRSYATALLETVEFLDGPALPAAPALASGASPVFDLKRRIVMIMSGSTRGRLSRGGTLTLLALGALALGFSPAFTSAQPEERKERPDGVRGERKEGPREAPPRERPQGDAPKERDRPQPPKDGANDQEIEELRKEMMRAREEAEKAMARVRELQEKMVRLGADRGGEFGRPPFRREGGFPIPPNGERPQGGDRQIQEMQRQIEDMRRMIEDLRRDLRVGGPEGGPKGPPMFERKGERPNNEPKDNPRRKPSE